MTELETKQQEVEALRQRLTKYKTNTSEKQNTKNKKEEKLFLVALITLLAAIPIMLVLRFIGNHVDQIIFLTLGLTTISFTVSFLVIKYKERILNYVFSTTKTHINEIMAPVPTVIDAIESRQTGKAKAEVTEVLKMVYAKYSWGKMRLFIVNTTMALFLGFGALLGAFLLLEQNKKLDTQNQLFTAQNKQVATQTKLFERQNELVAEQLKQVKKQNKLFEEQTRKLDTQNRLFGKQNQLVEVQTNFASEQTKLFRNQNELVKIQNKQEEAQTQLSESTRRSSLVFLFSNIMDKADQEIKQDSVYQKALKSATTQKAIKDLRNTSKKRNKEQITSLKKRIPHKKLSPQLEGRIIALSQSLKPYKYLEKDSLIDKPLSPERGQLLTSLYESGVDLNYISLHGAFEGADLNGANLTAADLVRVNLKRANLTRAALPMANLKSAQLIGTILNGANLRQSDLQNAALSFANLNEAILTGADLTGARLSSAILVEAVFFKANLTGANLTNTNLSGASLTNTLLPKARMFTKATFSNDTMLQQAFTTGPNWLVNITQCMNQDSPFNSKKYKLVKLNPQKILDMSQKHEFLKKWPKNKPLYQIRLR